MTRRLAILAVVAVVAAGLVGGIAVAQDSAETGTEESELTLEDLRQDGKHYSVDSARIVPSESQVYWLEHRPVNQPWTSVSASSNGEKLGEDAVLKTNTVYLRTIRASDETETVDVTVATYDVETREVKEGNTTRTEQVAANVSTTTHSVTLEPGWAIAEIDLEHHDETKQMTMWLNEHPETARWTLEHKSVATTTPLGVDSWSGFLMLAVGFVVVPALGSGIYGSRKVRQWVDKAGAPPGHGAMYYTILAVLATLGIVFWLYYEAAELIVTAPFVLGLGVGVVYLGYMLSTHEGQGQQKLFWQPHIENVEAFSKSKVPTVGADSSDDHVAFSEDMPFGQFQVHTVLDEGQDGLSIVRDGWLAFAARLKGGRARIENAHELKTRFPAWNSPWDEVFLVDPEADTILEYEPPGLALKTPEIDDWRDLVWPVAILGGGSVFAWQAAQTVGPVGWATLVVAVPLLVWKFAVTGTDSYVYIDPAPAAERPAIATALTAELGFGEAKDLEQMEELAARSMAQGDKENLEFVRRMVDTDIEERFGVGNNDDGDASTADIEPEDDGDVIDRIAGGKTEVSSDD